MKLLNHPKMYLLLGLMLSLCGINCKKGTTDTVYKGTVFFIGCYNGGIDIEGPAGYGKGIKWKDHTNAAAIGNRCLLDNLNIKVGTTITFQISDTNVEPGNNCAIPSCIAADDVPGSNIFIYNVTKLN